MKKFFIYGLIIISSVITFFNLNSSVIATSDAVSSEISPSIQNDKVSVKEESFEGVIAKIIGERRVNESNSAKAQLYQKLEIKITSGRQSGNSIVIETEDVNQGSNSVYKVGDELVLSFSKNAAGADTYTITDYVRRKPLYILFVIFVVVTVLIGKWKGLSSILGMGVSFLVILKFILPNIYNGDDPVKVAVFGSLAIIPITFFLSHGINRKTIVAIIGTLISLIATGILAMIFVDTAKLTGFASEEAGFLNVFKEGAINIKGLLLAGIIIGVLGVLDDITVSQAAIVEELKLANPQLKSAELYKKGMSVGKDHIASMVNTLILVYTGAALPLLLLFVDNSRPFHELINYEIVADEIVRTLVGSIGLVLAVPITTFIASNSQGDIKPSKK